jgi:alanyl-tRNA synthetase
MQDAYPELKESADRVSKAVLAEETRFAHTLDDRMRKLEDELSMLHVQKCARALKSDNAGSSLLDLGLRQGNSTASPTYRVTRAFKLYDTFGLPLDFIEDVCRDRGSSFDQLVSIRAMAEQRERARASWKGAAKQTANPAYQQLPKSEFEGYRQTRSDGCEVLAIIKGGQGAQELKAGESGEVILDHTPFYAESGGQVGDRGWLYSDDHNTIVAEVTGCYYPVQGVRAHQVTAKQPIRVGQKVDAVVDAAIRSNPLCAITRPRICFRPGCAKFWGSM